LLAIYGVNRYGLSPYVFPALTLLL
jgi:hypothetical protein